MWIVGSRHETIFEESLDEIYHYYGINSSLNIEEGNLMNVKIKKGTFVTE